jgi:hypothetical protein
MLKSDMDIELLVMRSSDNLAAMADRPGFKRQCEQVANVDMCKCVWRCIGSALHSDLAQVALHVLSMHPTCSAERNWSLQGWVYTAACNLCLAWREQTS